MKKRTLRRRYGRASTTHRYVVVLDISRVPRFYTGSGWNKEYPEAKLFTEAAARRVRQAFLRLGRAPGDESHTVDIVKDYGRASQKVVMT